MGIIKKSVLRLLPGASNDGFTLVELMIVCAIIGILSVGFMQVMTYQMRVSKTGDINKQLNDIKQQIQVWTFTQSYCDATFASHRNGEHIPGIKNADGTFLLKVGDRYPSTDWTISDMQILSLADVTAATSVAPKVDNTGLATAILRVSLNRVQTGTNTAPTQLTANQDSGSFGTNAKTIDFNFSAVFGSSFDVVGSGSDGGADSPGMLKTGSGGQYCATCVMSDGTTVASYLQTTENITSTIDSSNTTFSSDADSWPIMSGSCPASATQAQSLDGVPSTIGQTYCVPNTNVYTTTDGSFWTYGYVYNYDLPILNCATASTMFQNQVTGH